MHKVSENSNLTFVKSFIDVEPESHFPVQNLPFGVFEHPKTGEARCATAIGRYLVDLRELEDQNLFENTRLKGKRAFSFSTLDLFISLGPSAWDEARNRLTDLLSGDDPVLEQNPLLREKVFHIREDVNMLLPVRIRDVTHSMNFKIESGGQPVGNKLDPYSNQTAQQIPVLSPGRCSSVVMSGTGLNRPRGPRLLTGETSLTISPSRKLDVELSIGYITGKGSEPDIPMTLRKAGESIFGFLMVLNWIARDFITGDNLSAHYHEGQHLMSTISPWIVVSKALEPFKTERFGDEYRLQHLRSKEIQVYNTEFEISIDPDSPDESAVTAGGKSSDLYWSPEQELTHQAITGNRIEQGELFISGPVTEEIHRAEHLNDGDKIKAVGFARGDGYKIGFGEVSGRIEPVI